MMNNKFFTSGVSITDAHPLNPRGRALEGHTITDLGGGIRDYRQLRSRKQSHLLVLSEDTRYFKRRAPDYILQIFQKALCVPTN